MVRPANNFPEATDVQNCPSLDSCRREAASLSPLPFRLARLSESKRGWAGEICGRSNVAGLTDQTLSCAARARVATAARHAAGLHVSRAMQAA